MISKTLIFISTMLMATMAQANTTILECSFPIYANRDGIHPDKNFNFKIVVTEDGASMVGNNGSAPLKAVKGIGAYTFIEITATGNVMMTTIITKTGEAVHTRHSVFMDDLKLATQYYGFCHKG